MDVFGVYIEPAGCLKVEFYPRKLFVVNDCPIPPNIPWLVDGLLENALNMFYVVLCFPAGYFPLFLAETSGSCLYWHASPNLH